MMLRSMLGSVPGWWRCRARERERHFRSCGRRRGGSEPNSCHPRTLRRSTPQLQNSKFRPEPQLVNMTAGNSTSQSLPGSHGGRFSWFRLKKVDIFSVKDFLIVCDCGVWPAAVRRLAVPRGCCCSSLRKPLK